MKVTVHAAVFKKFPKMSIMVFTAKNIDNITHKEQAGHLVEEAAKLAQLTFRRKTLKNHHLISPWVALQKEFGKKAHMYHTSVEKLLKKTLRKENVKTHNTLINILRYLTLRHLVPIGVDDADKIRGDLTFDIAEGHERVHLFARVHKGALFYKDEKGPLGTKLDYWKSPRTAVHQNTQTAVFHVLCMLPVTKLTMQKIATEMEELLSGFCNAKVDGVILTENKRIVTIK